MPFLAASRLSPVSQPGFAAGPAVFGSRLAVLVNDAAKAHAKGAEPKPGAVGAVVKLIVVVAVESACHAQGAGQFINGGKAMRVRATRFVGDENVGLLGLEAVVVAWKNAAAVFARQAIAPVIAFAALRQVLRRTLEDGRCRGHPYFFAKHPAQSCNGNARTPQLMLLGQRDPANVAGVGAGVVEATQ